MLRRAKGATKREHTAPTANTSPSQFRDTIKTGSVRDDSPITSLLYNNILKQKFNGSTGAVAFNPENGERSNSSVTFGLYNAQVDTTTTRRR